MITIVNTGVSNIASVLNAFKRIGAPIQVSDDAETIQKSDHVILPGVGTALASIKNLKEKKLDLCIRELKQPVLGICLGMQIMYEHSDEGDVNCLGVFKGSIKRLSPTPPLPIPHMGWNQVQLKSKSKLLEKIPDGSHFYFVHSFRAPLGQEVVAISDYAEEIPAIIENQNWFGTQFHPERSGANGEQLLRNFLTL